VYTEGTKSKMYKSSVIFYPLVFLSILSVLIHLTKANLVCFQKSDGPWCSYGNSVYCKNGYPLTITVCENGCYFGSCEIHTTPPWYMITLGVVVPIIVIILVVIVLWGCIYKRKN
jgi:hypothetical protein